jgi:hypothetical protein
MPIPHTHPRIHTGKSRPLLRDVSAPSPPHPAASFPRRFITAPPPQDGKTALHWAARFGQLSLIDKLLAKGADIEAKDAKVHDCSRNRGQSCSVAAFH